MPIDVYFAPASGPSRAVMMTAKELGIDITLKEINIMAGEQNKPEYLKMNPEHTVPTIDDDGFYLWESRAIMAYLANKYAPDSSLYPKDPQKRAVVDRMLNFDLGTLYKAEFAFVYPQLFKGEQPDPEKEEAFKKALDLFNDHYLEKTYAAGSELTLADLSIFASLTFLDLIDYDLSSYSKISAWMSKLKSELPYYEEINDKPLKAVKEILKSRSQ